MLVSAPLYGLIILNVAFCLANFFNSLSWKTVCHRESFFSMSRSWVAKSLLREPQHDKTNKITCTSSKDSDQSGDPPVWPESSLSAWRSIGSLATHNADSDDWSDWAADAQADMSLRWGHRLFNPILAVCNKKQLGPWLPLVQTAMTLSSLCAT